MIRRKKKPYLYVLCIKLLGNAGFSVHGVVLFPCWAAKLSLALSLRSCRQYKEDKTFSLFFLLDLWYERIKKLLRKLSVKRRKRKRQRRRYSQPQRTQVEVAKAVSCESVPWIWLFLKFHSDSFIALPLFFEAGVCGWLVKSKTTPLFCWFLKLCLPFVSTQFICSMRKKCSNWSCWLQCLVGVSIISNTFGLLCLLTLGGEFWLI